MSAKVFQSVFTTCKELQRMIVINIFVFVLFSRRSPNLHDCFYFFIFRISYTLSPLSFIIYSVYYILSYNWKILPYT